MIEGVANFGDLRRTIEARAMDDLDSINPRRVRSCVGDLFREFEDAEPVSIESLSRLNDSVSSGIRNRCAMIKVTSIQSAQEKKRFADLGRCMLFVIDDVRNSLLN